MNGGSCHTCPTVAPPLCGFSIFAKANLFIEVLLSDDIFNCLTQ